MEQKIITRNFKATKKVEKLREKITDVELAKLLCISRTTMYKRLETGVWKGTELALIESLDYENTKAQTKN